MMYIRRLLKNRNKKVFAADVLCLTEEGIKSYD